MKLRKISTLLLSTLSVIIVDATVPGSSSSNEITYTQKRRAQPNTGAALYPQASDTRDVITLDGIWNFRKSPTDPEHGYRNGWYEHDLEKVIFVILLIHLSRE